ncbi:type VI secretion system contractile sheath large subunit [Paracoccus sp. (in: a-proteobacteria)]|uniref:type VI secretion system contractile sheath large subunit n=1 Tax=Paracoccus sp. TaxID=267 RepID=UPI003A8436C6
MSASALFVEAGQPDDPRSVAFRAFAASIDRLIAAIDDLLTCQLNVILHDPAFRGMEARWRALQMLVDQAGIGQGVLVRVLDAEWGTLARNLERAADFDQSHLFRMVYDEEFGMPGGLPFGLLVADYQIAPNVVTGGREPVEVLWRLASVAAAAFCPVVMDAAPQMFGFGSFADVSAASDMAAGRQDRPELIRWTGLRKADDARFLGLVAPGLMIRRPLTSCQAGRVDGFVFHESADRPLIIGGAFAFAATVVEAFQGSGWFAAIRGARQDEIGGGRVPGFAAMDFGTDRHGLSAQPANQFRPTPTQEDAMIGLGVIPMSSLYHDSDPVFNANPSLHLPPVFQGAVATQNARLGAMLQYVLCTSRFAHYLKVIMRDEIGSINDPSVIELRLKDWLRRYCLGNDDASQELKAQYPLRNADAHISEIAGRPGAYRCTIHLQPHFQLDDITTSFQLIAETSLRRNGAADAERNTA